MKQNYYCENCQVSFFLKSDDEYWLNNVKYCPECTASGTRVKKIGSLVKDDEYREALEHIYDMVTPAKDHFQAKIMNYLKKVLKNDNISFLLL